MLDQIDIGKGLGWSDDSHIFHFTDSGKSTIYRYTFDLDSGTLGEQRVSVAADTSSPGVPDGLA